MKSAIGVGIGRIRLLAGLWLAAATPLAQPVDDHRGIPPGASGVIGGATAALATADKGAPVISEFMASNGTTILDEDKDSPDWIEIHNPSASSVSLAGWFLSDSPTNLARWRFPSTNLAAGAYLVVFASGKACSISGAPLHTNFRLKQKDCFVALVHPDGTTIASSQQAAFPPDWEDISCGQARRLESPALVSRSSEGRYLIPTDGELPSGWTGGSEGFDDSVAQGWSTATGAVGFDLGTAGSAPIGFWDFNDASQPGVVHDRSGLGHDGVVRNVRYSADGEGRSGAAGDRAMEFASIASGAAVVIPSAASGMFDDAVSRDQVTFAAWVHGSDAMPANTTLFYASGNPDGSGTRCAQVHLPWGNNSIYWDTGGMPGTSDFERNRIWISEPDSSKWKGRWNHYVFVKDGPQKRIWQNGDLLLEGSNSEPLQPVRGFAIGVGEAQRLFSYEGLIDDFAVWDTALSVEQIQELALGASPLDARNLEPYVVTDLSGEMPGRATTVLLRYPFLLDAAAAIDVLLLRLRYKDGFIAYLNGIEVARDNAPAVVDAHSAALTPRPRVVAAIPKEFELTRFAHLLRSGTNVLALHGLSAGPDEPAFLLEAELLRGSLAEGRYSLTPTPGQPNGDLEHTFSGCVSPVTIDPEQHLFLSPATISLTGSMPGATLVYTLDGSLPSLTNGVRVEARSTDQGPAVTFSVTNTTLLRATAFKEGFIPAKCATFSCLFPARVAEQTRPNAAPVRWPDDADFDPASSYPSDFELDRRVIDAAAPGYGLTNALLSLPALSVVMPFEDLFGAEAGIYPNAVRRGAEWERAGSIELILPDGRRAFQTRAGIRIHGNISRYKYFTPKHSFDLIFHRPFGPPKLEYPLFDDSPVRAFDRLILRSDSIDAWTCFEGTPGNGEPYPRWTREGATYMRDEWMRRAQRALGHPASHGRYVHLYLNGLYWGLYDLTERPDASFAAAYLGGVREDYDVLADFAEVREGNANAWNEMMALAARGLSSNGNYFRLLGCNPDGSRNQAYPVYLDVTNLIDYCLLHIYAGADDWPDHNWWAARKRGPSSEGFRFFTWDQEITINSLLRTKTSWLPFPRFEDVSAPGSPGFLYDCLKANVNFRLLFADRVQRHLLAGALRPQENLVRWDGLAQQLDQAIVAESARWGDYRRASQPFLREVEWLTEQEWMSTAFWPSNHSVAMQRFRRVGLYPGVPPPEFSHPDGTVDNEFLLSISNAVPSSEVFYTLDGSDPRHLLGEPSPQSRPYSSAIALTPPVRVLARTRLSGSWSALVSASFQSVGALGQLVLTEIHYHPPSEAGVDGSDLEFVEFQNQGAFELDLSGVEVSGGISFAFQDGAHLLPGEFLVLARAPASLSGIFPGLRVSGIYQGRLDNSGDLIALTHPVAGLLCQVDYSDRVPWPMAADGLGASLQRIRPKSDPSDPASWMALSPTPGQATARDALDSDGDGLDDAWETAHNLDPYSETDAETDPDRDGATNRQEYLAGTDPRDANDRFQIVATRYETAEGGNRVEVGFSCKANRKYTLLVSERGPSGPWAPVASLAPLSNSALTNLVHLAPPSQDPRFYRLAIP